MWLTSSRYFNDWNLRVLGKLTRAKEKLRNILAGNIGYVYIQEEYFNNIMNNSRRVLGGRITAYPTPFDGFGITGLRKIENNLDRILEGN